LRNILEKCLKKKKKKKKERSFESIISFVQIREIFIRNLFIHYSKQFRSCTLLVRQLAYFKLVLTLEFSWYLPIDSQIQKFSIENIELLNFGMNGAIARGEIFKLLSSFLAYFINKKIGNLVGYHTDLLTRKKWSTVKSQPNLMTRAQEGCIIYAWHNIWMGSM
jgi:hypothetical protein